MNKNYILSCIGIGIDFYNLVKDQINIEGFLTLKYTDRVDISGFINIKEYCIERGLNCFEFDNYSLKDGEVKLNNVEIDNLFVAGWQRLVPPWLINNVNYHIFGYHGSIDGITKGRGRSPLNWAIIMGFNLFKSGIFIIDEGIDSGIIVNEGKFQINSEDDIDICYKKSIQLYANLLLEYFKDSRKRIYKVQKENNSYYFPQRTPEDGFIDWNLGLNQIENIVKALNRPYPLARTKLKNQIILIEEVLKFEFICNNQKVKNGEIVFIFQNNRLVVKTSDGFLLIKKYFIEGGVSFVISVGDILESVDYKKTLSKIFLRHKKISK